MLEKIVSGGQTGVDRAALDAAQAAGYVIGGWCPRGRRAEDGRLPGHYPLQETPQAVYPQRTAWNVRDSDGTLVLLAGPPQGGTALTVQEAEQRGRPLLVLKLGEPENRERVQAWIGRHEIQVLNVAGPRASEVPGIYATARAFLEDVFQYLTQADACS